MNADFRRVKEIFLAAVENQDTAERDAYVREACGKDEDLRRQVDALLGKHAQAGSFLEAQAPGPVVTVDVLPVLEQPGTTIGPYKLLELIGEGGMGAVWMAEQREPVRKVALKIIKAGMDTRQVVARFEAERQALALMDHPNIAKVFDGGTTAGGRPYFVMELVKGVPITQYCDEHRLTPRERLELFLPVCQAIQHAHTKGIIHRDVKPANVLVAPYDGVPVPKVIDFGVAKATGQRLTEHTLFTGFGAVVGTVEYMSPEQAELNNRDIDTRSDIYSLGVLLYELLTGTTPLTHERLKQAAFTETLRLIREEEPPKPSTRLSESKDTLPSISAQRHTVPARLTKEVRGELDWIVMKALEKDRRRRYETANGLATDVQHYLADEPVQACPPSTWYRFGKFARRNKAGLAIAGLILFCLASLGGGAGWVVRDQAARRAKAANDLELALDRAEMLQGEGKRADALAALERAELLADHVPAGRALDARRAAVKERLDAEARDHVFLGRFGEIWLQVESQVDVEAGHFSAKAAYPEIQEALRQYGIALGVLAPAQAAARVQARPEPVRRHLIAALDECLRLAPKEETQTRQWLLAALAAADTDAWRVRARKAAAAQDWQALEQLAREVDVRQQPSSFLVAVARDLPAPMRATRLELLRRVQRAYPADLWANHWLACELQENGQPAEAVRYYTAALALRPDNPGIYLNRGVALIDAGEVDAAIADAHQALVRAPDYAEAHCNLGLALRNKGQLDEAIAEYREAIRLKKDLPTAHLNLGVALSKQKKLDEAIACYQKAITLDPKYALAHNNLGAVLQEQKKLDEAIACYNKAIAEYRAAPRTRQSVGVAFKAHTNLGNALLGKGELDAAIAEYREALRFRNDSPQAHYQLGLALHGHGQFPCAEAEFREALRLRPDFPEARAKLGYALWKQGKNAEAEAACREVLRLRPGDPEAYFTLGLVLYWGGEKAAAGARFYAEAFAAHPKLADDLRFPNRSNAACHAALAGCGRGQDAAGLDDAERERLRRQALSWLRADLAAWGQLLEKQPDQARARMQQALQEWQQDADFAGVRGDAMAKLPEAERQPWQQLWAAVEKTLRKVDPKNMK